MTEHKLDAAKALEFILAGNATFTLRSNKTGTRFTYKVQIAKNDDGTRGNVHFVKLLTGPDNTSDYQYVGMVKNGALQLTAKSKLSLTASAVVAFTWTLKHLTQGVDPHVEIWHAGRCGRCGRMLTVPESIASGIGPDCAGRM